MRLDRYLADCRLGSRKEVKELIRSGRVSVNSDVLRDPGAPVSDTDMVCLDGELLSYSKYVYYMMNKPAGVITATSDAHASTVLDLISPPVPKGLSPVGRLDKDTVGLLILTNDGELNHRLLSPKSHVPKTYFAKVTSDERYPDDSDVQAFSAGLGLSDMTCLPAKLQIYPLSNRREGSVFCSEAEVTVYEGKFHQVKRMFDARGFKVTYLKRVSMGELKLDEELAEGAYRPLTEEELSALKKG